MVGASGERPWGCTPADTTSGGQAHTPRPTWLAGPPFLMAVHSSGTHPLKVLPTNTLFICPCQHKAMPAPLPALLLPLCLLQLQVPANLSVPVILAGNWAVALALLPPTLPPPTRTQEGLDTAWPPLGWVLLFLLPPAWVGCPLDLAPPKTRGERKSWPWLHQLSSAEGSPETDGAKS